MTSTIKQTIRAAVDLVRAKPTVEELTKEEARAKAAVEAAERQDAQTQTDDSWNAVERERRRYAAVTSRLAAAQAAAKAHAEEERQRDIARYEELVEFVSKGQAGVMAPHVDRIAALNLQLAEAIGDCERELAGVERAAYEAMSLADQLGAKAIGLDPSLGREALDLNAEHLLRRARERTSFAGAVRAATLEAIKAQHGAAAVVLFNELAPLLAKAD
jgi:hypothetical protein